MKRTAMCLIILALLLAPTAASAAPKGPIGPRLLVWSGLDPAVITAGSPFHVRSGYVFFPPLEAPLGLWRGGLDIDGTFIEEDFVDRGSLGTLPKELKPYAIWFFNFPEGLQVGTYTFTVHFSGPCQPLVDYGDIPGPCERPTELIEWTMSRTVVVTPP